MEAASSRAVRRKHRQAVKGGLNRRLKAKKKTLHPEKPDYIRAERLLSLYKHNLTQNRNSRLLRSSEEIA